MVAGAGGGGVVGAVAQEAVGFRELLGAAEKAEVSPTGVYQGITVQGGLIFPSGGFTAWAECLCPSC